MKCLQNLKKIKDSENDTGLEKLTYEHVKETFYTRFKIKNRLKFTVFQSFRLINRDKKHAAIHL